MWSKTQLSYKALQQCRWLVHIAGVVAVVGFAYLGWKAQRSIQVWHAEMQQEIEQDRRLLGEIKKIEEQLAEALQTRETVSASFRALRDRVPVRLVDSEVLRAMEEIVSACDCKLNDFRPIGSLVLDAKELKCKMRSFQLTMDGSYMGLFAFARELDRFPFLVQVKRLHLVAPANTNTSSRIDLEIGILYAPEWAESELISANRDRA